MANTPQPVPQTPRPSDRPAPVPTDSGDGTTPGGDVLGQILRELEKGIREGRVKPVIVGPYEIDIPGTSKPGGPGQHANSWRRYPRPDPARNARRQRRQTAIARSGVRFGFGGVRRSDRDRQRTSTRVRSTACKRCSTASSARSSAELRKKKLVAHPVARRDEGPRLGRRQIILMPPPCEGLTRQPRPATAGHASPCGKCHSATLSGETSFPLETQKEISSWSRSRAS